MYYQVVVSLVNETARADSSFGPWTVRIKNNQRRNFSITVGQEDIIRYSRISSHSSENIHTHIFIDGFQVHQKQFW